MSTVVTPELKELLNVDFGPKSYLVERWMLQKFAEAIEDPNPAWMETAPPAFVCILRLEELIDRVWGAPCPLTTKLNAGNRLEYFHPIKLGDTISVSGRLVDLSERAGKRGPMLIMKTVLSFSNQRGELVARLHRTLIRK